MYLKAMQPLMNKYIYWSLQALVNPNKTLSYSHSEDAIQILLKLMHVWNEVCNGISSDMFTVTYTTTKTLAGKHSVSYFDIKTIKIPTVLQMFHSDLTAGR